MNVGQILILLVIAGICGSIAKTLAGFKRGGCLVSIVVGFIGAYIGTILAREFRFPDFLSFEVGGIDFPVIWSIIGAALFTTILSIVVPKK